MYVASKQRYGEDLDSFEHATEKHRGLNMHWKQFCAKKSEQPMNPRELGVLECKNPIYDQNGQN